MAASADDTAPNRPAPLAGCGVTIREAGPDDEVAGVMPRWVALPESTEEVGAVMRAAAEQGLAVVPAGAGTKLHWGAPPTRCDLLLDTCCLNQVLEHEAGDLVVRVQAGVTTEALAGVLGAAGQELALDVPVEGATVGGTLATATAGPRRLRYGTARDLLIGITVVLADGTIAKSGGKVVKNVAGYDLGKLFTGSLGTLGVIAEATFRLHPLAAARAWITATFPGLHSLPDVAAVAGSQSEPSAVEIDLPEVHGPATVAVLVEGVAARERAKALADLLGPAARLAGEPPEWWGRLPAGEFLLELRVLPAAAVEALAAVASAAQEAGDVPVRVRGAAASAVLHLSLPPDTPAAAAETFVTALRSRMAQRGGRLVVWSAPSHVAPRLDRFGHSGAAVLMRRVKRRFDPDDRMAPGRLLGESPPQAGQGA
ncbi:FAD-binding oxidoreductase [Sphaerisporangium fuscum]|uniref:FAD-binding oxidoreductase n=1 Tax=Sphaerisporangium fuscum TaxID=2835868 RepID=UPI001BDD0499|nr:FAD-binding oxidoreductase [Sphaerisporangium fuscum]